MFKIFAFYLIKLIAPRNPKLESLNDMFKINDLNLIEKKYGEEFTKIFLLGYFFFCSVGFLTLVDCIIMNNRLNDYLILFTAGLISLFICLKIDKNFKEIIRTEKENRELLKIKENERLKRNLAMNLYLKY